MALSKIQSESVNLADNFAFTGTVSGAGGGKVLQAVVTNKLDVFSTASTTFTDVTGLSVQITPSATTSRILVTGALVCSSGSHWIYARLMRDSTPVLVPSGTLGNRTTANFGFGTYQASNYMPQTLAIHALDSPSSTSLLTYKIQVEGYNAASAVYVNKTERDSDNAAGYDMRGCSTICVMEIGA